MTLTGWPSPGNLHLRRHSAAESVSDRLQECLQQRNDCQCDHVVFGMILGLRCRTRHMSSTSAFCLWGLCAHRHRCQTCFSTHLRIRPFVGRLFVPRQKVPLREVTNATMPEPCGAFKSLVPQEKCKTKTTHNMVLCCTRQAFDATAICPFAVGLSILMCRIQICRR